MKRSNSLSIFIFHEIERLHRKWEWNSGAVSQYQNSKNASGEGLENLKRNFDIIFRIFLK